MKRTRIDLRASQRCQTTENQRRILVKDVHVGSTFVSAEWEALYHNRARA